MKPNAPDPTARNRHAIRPACAADLDQLREICILTGDAGADARGKEDAPELLPAIFLEPYVSFAPDCAFVAEDTQGVCGYAVGVTDSRAFAKWQARAWWPDLRRRHSDPGSDQTRWQGSDWLRRWLHHPPDPLPPGLERWPAHGHIDLLPRAQGTGLARPLMLRLMDSLAAGGAPGLHLGVAAENARALRFYFRLGFAPVPDASSGDTVYVARSLQAESH